MVTEIKSKSELAALATQLSNEATNLAATVEALASAVGSATDYDGISVTGAASIIKSNLEIILADLEIVSANITSYVNEINNFDINDLEFEEVIDEATLDDDIDSATVVTVQDNTSSATSNQTNTTDLSSSAVAGLGTVAITGGYSNESSTSNETPSTTTPSTNTTPSSSSSKNTGDSKLTSSSTITPSGKTSSNGRTQRSALTEIKTGIGDKDIDVSHYHNNEANGFVVTTGNTTYELCDEDFELLCAIVSAESDKTYDDALAVITTILNRCETSNWIASHGRDPIAQATAPNQFVVYQHGSYEGYMNGKAPDTVVQAVTDALAGVRNHNYCSFRSNGSTGYSNNMISSTGNRYK